MSAKSRTLITVFHLRHTDSALTLSNHTISLVQFFCDWQGTAHYQPGVHIPLWPCWYMSHPQSPADHQCVMAQWLKIQVSWIQAIWSIHNPRQHLELSPEPVKIIIESELHVPDGWFKIKVELPFFWTPWGFQGQPNISYLTVVLLSEYAEELHLSCYVPIPHLYDLHPESWMYV